MKGREIEEKLRALRGGRLLFLPHAIQQMTRYLAIITAYLPDPDEWSRDFRMRKKP